MATSKSTSAGAQRKSGARSNSSASKSGSTPARRRSSATRSSNGSRATGTSSRSSRSASRGTQSRNGTGMVETLKQGAGKAKAPAVAAGAAVAGLAGGLVLKNRLGRKRVLGVRMPRSLTDVDVKALAKTVGDASTRFGKTTKTVSKDMERVGDQAERIGKILG
jgi:hypothetical protein